jgi:5-methylcytosine-specific restriction endonuclease McrA
MALLKVCGDCFQTYQPWSRNNRGRCPDCLRKYEREKRQRRGSTTQRGLGAEHQRLAKQVLSEEKACWLCGHLARPNDPLEVDHVVPRSKGGATVRSNLRAAHASCNRSRGGGGRGRLEGDGQMTRKPVIREIHSKRETKNIENGIAAPDNEFEPLVG